MVRRARSTWEEIQSRPLVKGGELGDGPLKFTLGTKTSRSCPSEIPKALQFAALNLKQDSGKAEKAQREGDEIGQGRLAHGCGRNARPGPGPRTRARQQHARQPLVPSSPGSPHPSLGAGSAHAQKRSRARRRAGVKRRETISFVAEAWGGGGEGPRGGARPGRNARKCYPGSPRAPAKTRIELRAPIHK